MKKTKLKQKGITLVALIITIIVMLIIVGVSVNIILGNSIFKVSQKATKETKEGVMQENTISSGQVTINDNTYSSMEEYIEEPSIEYANNKKVNFELCAKSVQANFNPNKNMNIGFCDSASTAKNTLVAADTNHYDWFDSFGTYEETKMSSSMIKKINNQKLGANNSKISLPNMFPGDMSTQYFTIKVDDQSTVYLNLEIQSSDEELLDVLNCKIRILNNSEEILYDGKMRDIPEGLPYSTNRKRNIDI